MLALLMAIPHLSNAQVVIGTGSTSNVQRYPFSFWYGYSRDATIYTASEINTANTSGTVTTLAWKSSIASTVTAPIVIYLKEVGSTTAVANDTWANTIAGATQVYAGTPANWVIGWNTIDITDFQVNAGQNLEVLVECAYTGSGGGGQTGTQFIYTSSGSNTHGYWQKDSSPPVGTTSADGGLNANRPDITFGGLVPPNMAYASSTTTQSSTAVVAPGSTNQQMVRLEISVTGAVNPLSVSQLNFTTGNTNVPANISNAKVFYTGESSTFATTSQYGSIVNNPSGAFTVSGSQTLTSSGLSTATFYFWLTYDVRCSGVNASDSFDAACSGFTIGSTGQTPTVTNPTGTRVISIPSIAYTATTTTSASVGATNVPLGRINITGDNCNSLVTSVKFNTASSLLADITDARCYYTTSTTFSTDSLYGSPIVSPNGDLVFNGSKTLATGSGNYFWVTYSIGCSAGTVAGVDSVVAIPVSITTNMGATSVATPTTNAKKGIVAATGFSSVADGDWNASSTWACGAIPTATSNVTINNAVTVSTSGNVAANVTISSGKSLTISTGSLTMGAAGGDNKVFTNNGTLTVSGGTFNINGQFINGTSATFNQSGGNINVDPNASGTGTSVTGSSNYPINLTITTAANLSLTGGVFTLVDPPSTASTSSYAMYVSYTPAGSVAAGSNHTFRFGDGVSTDAGGTTGYRYYSWNGSGIFKFGKLILETNTANAASRFVYINGTYFNLAAVDDITIRSGAELRQTGTALTGGVFVGKNLTVESGGKLTVPGIVYFGNVTSASATSLTGSATSNAQVVTGAGATFRNSETTSTANFGSLTINNSSTGGVTFADANSLVNGTNTGTVSGTLTMIAGSVNVGANALVLGTSASSTGTYTYTAGNINGKFKRWIAASTGSRVFDIATSTGSKQVTINFTTAPTSGGSITTAFSATDPGSAGLPLTEGSVTYTNASALGFWTVTVGDGFAGGVYNASFRGTGFNDVSGIANLALGKRSNSSDNWALVGTLVATTGTNGDFVISRTGLSGFSDFGVMNAAQPLAVKLLSFNGYNAGTINVLAWETGSEKDFDHFELQRSADASTFMTIAKIEGGSNKGSKYQYEDKAALTGKNFYRLNMVDKNGTLTTSKVIELNVKAVKSFTVVAHPNPVKQLLQVDIAGNMDSNPNIQVFDMVGKLIRTIKPVANTTYIDMSNLSNGFYIIKYSDNSHSSLIKVNKN